MKKLIIRKMEGRAARKVPSWVSYITGDPVGAQWLTCWDEFSERWLNSIDIHTLRLN